MMFICVDCGHVFDEPRWYKGDRLEHFGTTCREEWSGCPICGGSYVPTTCCDMCGETILDDYYRIGRHIVCEECCRKCKLEDGGIE